MSATCMSRIMANRTRRRRLFRKPSGTAARGSPPARCKKWLPEALHIVETRERLDAFSATSEPNIERLRKHYRDFVALCARKEDETGIPCLIIARR